MTYEIEVTHFSTLEEFFDEVSRGAEQEDDSRAPSELKLSDRESRMHLEMWQANQRRNPIQGFL